MKLFLRNLLAIIVGILIGAAVNMGIIMMSSHIIPSPNGVDVTTLESLKENMHLFKPINFLMPWLAHGLGTLVGAFLATKIAASNKLNIAMAIGIFFIIGGIEMVYKLPSPVWFSITDLGFAYIPMAWIGYKLAK